MKSVLVTLLLLFSTVNGAFAQDSVGPDKAEIILTCRNNAVQIQFEIVKVTQASGGVSSQILKTDVPRYSYYAMNKATSEIYHLFMNTNIIGADSFSITLISAPSGIKYPEFILDIRRVDKTEYAAAVYKGGQNLSCK